MAFNKFNKSRDNRGGGERSFGGASRGYEGSDNRGSGDRDNRSSGGSNRFGAGRSFGGGESRGGGRSFGGRSSFGGHSDGPKQMFPATCGECGERCEVPFRPTGTHPVFCSNCFQGQNSSTSGSSTRFSPPKSFGGGNAGASVSAACGVTKAQIDTLNVKLDKILSLLSTVKSVAAPKVETEVEEVEDEEKPKTSFLAAKKAKKAAKKK